MKNGHFTKLFRLFLALTFLLATGAAFPRPVQAANPWIEILSVQVDESVKIRAHDFPAGQLFTVRMDVSGNQAINGIVVTVTNTGAGGNFEETYRIPAELHGVQTLSIRLESPQGYSAYNWFTNNTSSSSNIIPATGIISPAIKIVGVEANKKVTVKATGFPAGQYFSVRVGPFYTFARNYEVVDTVYSGSGGTFEFNANLPGMLKDGEWVAIRLDSPQKYYAYNAFKNLDSGTVNPTPSGTVVTNACQIVSVTPNKSMPTRYDFDAVWTVKNTSGKTWESYAVDYKYLSGRDMYKHNAIYDLPKRVKDGESIKIIVDMKSPGATGTYSTRWALVQGSTTLCELPLTITVK